ncbi:nuclear transport factor 2 family protein [Shewanella sp. UCD-KL21]|uniref:YybH family protein n=1 Tax=Shewanella sp. UCD-KL21 TaxID=1917164 RepID=UPI0020C941C8|nr:nuclear transport factor 2 family protein [Shewanella sp. UCD-KL21]
MTDNEIINQNYKTFASGFENLDISIIETMYTDDAVYLSETPNQGIITGKPQIVELYQHFFEKIAKREARIEVDFRVINRKLTNDSATDVGFYLVRFHPKKETGDQISVFSGKFVFVSQKDANNQWQFIVDSNTKMNPELYYSAKPISNLYYGRQFNTEAKSKSVENEVEVGSVPVEAEHRIP